jgi:putative ABC transport system permease protein
MSIVRTLTLRSIKARPTRVLLSTFGIVLGVAAILGIGITNQTALDSVELLFEDTAGKTDLMVISAEADGGFSENVLQQFGRISEVKYAIPSVQIITTQGDASSQSNIGLSFFGMDSGGIQLYGIDPEIDREARNYQITQGRFLDPIKDKNEIVLVDSFAEENDLHLNDDFEIITETGIEKLSIVGLMEKKGAGQINNGAFGVIPILIAQKLFYRTGELDQIDLILKSEYSTSNEIDKIKEKIQDLLGIQYSVVYPASQGQRMTQMLSNYQIGLNFLSGMALFVGAFLIYNAFSMNVVEKTREIGLLRTVGMTRSQIIRLIIYEAFILGVIGSILGMLLGILLARDLSTLMGTLISQDLNQVDTPQNILIVGIIVGIGVAVVSALIPALQAGRISPMEALRIRTKSRSGWILEKGWIPGLLMLITCGVILVINPFPYDVQFRMGSMVVIFMFLGGTLVIPASVGVWNQILRPFMIALFGRIGVIGISNVSRAKLRTTLTVGALLVGVSMMVIVWTITDSFKGDLDEWLQGYLGGDLYVSSPLSMGPNVRKRLEAIEGVEATAPVRYMEVEWFPTAAESESINIMAIDPGSYAQVTSFVFSNSSTHPDQALQNLAQGDYVFISTVIAELYDINQGDSVMIKTKRGIQSFKVAAEVVEFYNQGYVITLGWTDMERYFREEEAQSFLIKTQDEYLPEGVGDRIDDLYGDRYRLIIVSNRNLIEEASTLLEQAFSMFDVLAIIAIVVGFFGIANTLTMSIIERTREIGMLRGVGMTRTQILSMVLSEAATMGIIGGVLGVIFGIILSRIFLVAMSAMSGYQITYIFPFQKSILALVVAFIVSQLAALLPAGRATRIKILDAIQYE